MRAKKPEGKHSSIAGTEYELLLLLSKLKKATIYALEKNNKLGLDSTNVKYWINKLVEKNLVLQAEEDNKAKYSINPETVRMANGGKATYIKHRGNLIIFAESNSDIWDLLDLIEKDVTLA